MAKAGRPKKPVGDEVKQVRINADLAEMLSWIAEVDKRQTIAQILDPIIRRPVQARYAELAYLIEPMKKKQEELDKLKAQAAEKLSQRDARRES